MQQQERDLIGDLFGRLQQFESQPRDPEAERLIAGYVGRQPAATYLLTQTVLVQEEALKQARARIAELEAKTSQNTSFLGSAPKVGPWGGAPAQPQQPAPPPAQPWGAAAPAQAAGGGGSFLRTALTTAAGVAGGALLFQGISSMFGHGTQALANPAMGSGQAGSNPLGDPGSTSSSPDRFSSADLAQDDGAADDYDLTADNSGFDSSNDDI
jgi:hypothetical protein